MPPDTLTLSAAQSRLARISAKWRAPLLRLGGAWLALIVLFGADWLAMARQWWDISTYNHVLLIPVILGWLVWQRAPQLARIVPTVWWPGLVLFAGAVLLWVLGSFAGMNLAQQAGAVGVLVASATLLLGPRASAGLAFPLGYMFLLVPFGDELVPPLQMITAALTIGLVHLSGIEAVIDGVFIHTPAGLFEVAEACSGVKFLIAMIAFGILVSNVCFAAWWRRAIFLTFCIAVPILANGLRAWATVFAAQYVGAESATGFDHIVYGWFFFAAVIALVLAMSWRFFDRPLDDAFISADAINAAPWLGRLSAMSLSPALALALLGVLAICGAAWARAADAMDAAVPAQIFLPDVPGWSRAEYRPRAWWEPRASGAAHRLLGSYSDGKGNQVDVFYALYSAQRDGGEAGGFGEGALRADEGWSWQSPGPPTDGAKSDRLLSHTEVGRLAVTYYRTGSLLTGSNSRLKFANMADRLLLRERPTILLILSAEEAKTGNVAAAQTAIAAFRTAAGPTDQWMDRIAGLR